MSGRAFELLVVLFELLSSLIAPLSWPVWIYVLPAPRSILRVGRNKSSYRELMKSMSIIDKILMRDFVNLSRTAKRLQRFFIVWTYLFYLSIIVFALLIVVYRTPPHSAEYFKQFLFVKAFFVELPAIIVFKVNRYPDRWNGRHWEYEWKFKRDYKRTRKSGHNQ